MIILFLAICLILAP